MDQLLDKARSLQFDHTYLLALIGVAGVSVLLLHFAEMWGVARARRRTERAIAALEASGPPEG